MNKIIIGATRQQEIMAPDLLPAGPLALLQPAMFLSFPSPLTSSLHFFYHYAVSPFLFTPSPIAVQ